jgi:hypothetical protein
MSTITTAYARQKKWVGVDCEMCGIHYSCLVEAVGQASDDLLPFSDNTLKEFALLDLDCTLQRKATSNPCPQCGAYPQSHVEQARKTSGCFIVWGLFLAISALITFILVMLAPNAPAWTLIIILVISLVSSRLLSGSLVDKFDPNRDLERNRRIAQAKLSSGTIRVQSQATEGGLADLSQKS